MRDSASISGASLDTVMMMMIIMTKIMILMMMMTGVYGRRSAAPEAGLSDGRERVRVMVPPHLYGQLAATR